MLKDQYPDAFAAWEAAGGITNNFKKHLLGIGVLAPTADDLKFLADETQASVTQLRNALDRYPL